MKGGSGPKAAPQTAATAIDLDSIPRRFAEDADLQLAEIERLLDSADIVVMDSLGGGNFTPTQAGENVLSVHARVRRHLALLRVAA